MSSEGSQRVSFWFGRETEVRYLTRLPEVGDHVTHGSELWVVLEVTTDALGALVICQLPVASGA